MSMISRFNEYSFKRIIVEPGEVFLDLLGVCTGNPKGSLPPQPLFKYPLRVFLNPSLFFDIRPGINYFMTRQAGATRFVRARFFICSFHYTKFRMFFLTWKNILPPCIEILSILRVENYKEIFCVQVFYRMK